MALAIAVHGLCQCPNLPTILEATMDFIERVFGIAPDGGNGLLELAIVVCIFAVAVAVWRVRSRRPELN